MNRDLLKLPVMRIELEQYTRMLSEREIEIVNLLLRRLKPGEIAVELDRSPLTVKKHIANIYRKLNITDRQQLFEKILHTDM